MSDLTLKLKFFDIDEFKGGIVVFEDVLDSNQKANDPFIQEDELRS